MIPVTVSVSADLELARSPLQIVFQCAIHLVVAGAILYLPYQSPVVPLSLLALLLGNFLIQYGLARRKRQDLLCWNRGQGWFVRRPGLPDQPVLCTFEFLSALLVVVRVNPVLGQRGRQWVLTPGRGGEEAWRVLHLLGRSSWRASGEVDDDVLGREIDGDQDRVQGNR